jgi:hypothetical protein
MGRPLKKDGTEDMRYNDGLMNDDICVILKFAAVVTLIVLLVRLGMWIWELISGIWNWIF